MGLLRITTSDDRVAVVPGEEIEVVASWELDAPPESVEVRLVWETRGKGDTDREIVWGTQVESPRVVDSRPFAVRLPHGPYSCSGKLISLVWHLEVEALRKMGSAKSEIVLSPHGSEVLLAGEESQVGIHAGEG